MSAEWLRSSQSKGSFRRRLLAWYDANQRALPWRGERDVHKVWISEIMLQQTRVAVVKERYRRFVRRFPTLRALARAPIDHVLAEWSGLGYYRRARNLHAAAKKIVAAERQFPRTAAELMSLPGIGRYTSAAIASIAFNEPVAAVDGNVERVLGRLRGRAPENSWHMAMQLLDSARPGDFNQAMMELGATVCLPNRAPECSRCPVVRFCATRGKSAPAGPKAKREKVQVAYALRRTHDSVFLISRPAAARLMPGMWELPRARSSAGVAFHLKHSITTTDYRISVVAYSCKKTSERKNGQWHKISTLDRLPLTGLARKVIARAVLAKNKIV